MSIDKCVLTVAKEIERLAFPFRLSLELVDLVFEGCNKD